MLRLEPDLDAVEALSPEREALWARLDAAGFLTDDEKRAAAGYGPKPEEVADDSAGPFAHKYNPNQSRVPAGNPDGGQWTDGGGGSRTQVANPLRRLLRRRPAQQPKQPAPPPVPIPPGKVIRNKGLAGGKHRDTGIPFDKDGFPDFSGVAKKTVKVPHTGKRHLDEAAANREAGLKSTPKDMTWHHHQDGRTMQLVPKDIHDKTGHTGSIGIGNLPGKKEWEVKQMYPRMSDPNTPIKSGKVEEFEARIQRSLPEGYKIFLKATNGGQPELRAFPVKDYEDDNLDILNQFSGLGADKPSSDLLDDYDFFAGRIPDGIIIIGHTDGGDKLCFDLRNGKQKVVLWDHKHFWGTGEWREQDLYHVANTFDELLAAMYPNPYM